MRREDDHHPWLFALPFRNPPPRWMPAAVELNGARSDGMWCSARCRIQCRCTLPVTGAHLISAADRHRGRLVFIAETLDRTGRRRARIGGKSIVRRSIEACIGHLPMASPSSDGRRSPTAVSWRRYTPAFRDREFSEKPQAFRVSSWFTTVVSSRRYTAASLLP